MVSQQLNTGCKPNIGQYSAMPDTPSKELADALFAVAEHRDERAFAILFQYFSPKIKRFGIDF